MSAAPEFLEISEHEVSTRARRIPGYGLAPYPQQSAVPMREVTERSAHAQYAEPATTLPEYPRRRRPNATPEPELSHHSRSSSLLSQSRSTAKVAPTPIAVPSIYPERSARSRDVAPPSAYPAPKEIAPAKSARAREPAVPSIYPAPKEISPAKSARDAVPSAYPAPKEISPAKSSRREEKRVDTASVSASAPSASKSKSRSEKSRSAPSVRAEGSQPKVRPAQEAKSSSQAAPLPAPPPGPTPASVSQPAPQAARDSGSVSTPAPTPSQADMPGMIDPLQVPIPPELAPSIYTWVRRLALQNDLATADRVLRDGLLELTSSLDVKVIYPGQDGLWSLGGDEELPKDPTPIIACAQARRALIASHTALIPIITTTETVAVVILTRNPRNPGYHALESIAGLGLIRESAAILHHLASAHIQKQSEIALDKGSLYRGEALEAHRSRGNEGVPVHISPNWVRRAYPFLCGAIVLAIVFMAWVKVPTYATGEGSIVIRGDNVTAPYPGTAGDVLVSPGQRVKKGSVMLRMTSQAEADDVAGLKTSYDQYATQYMFDPTDENNKKQMIEQFARLDAAKMKLEQKTIRAPRDGIISDIRVRTGQPLNVGEPIATIVQEGADIEVVALVPAGDRPQLRATMKMQVNLAGYTKGPEMAPIIEIGTEAISGSPSELAKIVGPALAESMKVAPGASYVVVRGRMPKRTFVANSQKLYYHHGMGARIDIKLSEKPFLATLLPALEKYIPN